MRNRLSFQNVYYLPSGRIFVLKTKGGYTIECTEMRDVLVGSKLHAKVRTSQDPKLIWKHLAPYKDKWLLTVSTQKGCPHNCQMCDVAPLPFKGNLSQEEIEDQIRYLLYATPYAQSNKAKIGFARMGEPAHNIANVLGAILSLVSGSLDENTTGQKWLPCFNSILPRQTIQGLSGQDVLKRVLKFKEVQCNGRLHFQISCNSTDEEKRKELFGGADVLTIKKIIDIVNQYDITDRTVTLNFIVMKGVEVDVKKLMDFGLNPDKFMVKLIPLNETDNAKANNLETVANYNNYDDLKALADKFKANGIPVVFDAIAKCEEAGLCCGQLVSANQKPVQHIKYEIKKVNAFRLPDTECKKQIGYMVGTEICEQCEYFVAHNEQKRIITCSAVTPNNDD